MHEDIEEAEKWRSESEWKGEGLDGGVILEIMHLADGDGGTHDGASCIYFDLWVPYKFVYCDENGAYLRVKGLPHNIHCHAFTTYG